jgi:hypothetical protein
VFWFSPEIILWNISHSNKKWTRCDYVCVCVSIYIYIYTHTPIYTCEVLIDLEISPIISKITQISAVAQWLRYCATNQKSLYRSQMVSIIHWHKSFWSHYGPGVDSASNRNEHQENFLGVNAAGAYGWQPYHHPVPLSRNLGTLTFWNPLGHPRPVTGLHYLFLLIYQISRISIQWEPSCFTQSDERTDILAWTHTHILTCLRT